MSKIVVFGDPVLEKKTEPVTKFNKKLEELVSRMHTIMIQAPGVGLAAPQIGIGKSVCIVDITVGEDPKELHVLINPEILEEKGSQTDEEGCLSFPDLTTVVKRPEYVKVRAQNLQGELFEVEAEGFLARAFCHEIDHLNGILMTDRVSRLKREIIKKRISKRVKEGKWHS
ncbi:MAG: peptide deformylase [Acidobacteria bacterium]|nr:MAG: peptide deformylase [Acidobacteriota bacterium]